jgi:hypothetical protein
MGAGGRARDSAASEVSQKLAVRVLEGQGQASRPFYGSRLSTLVRLS